MSKSNGATMTAPGKGVMGSGTVGGLMAFFDYLVQKGIATPSAVTPLKSAAKQVFETVEGTDEIDEMDVRSLDVEEYLDRFQVKAIGTGRYKPESITAYRKRFARGLEYYSTYLTSGAVPKLRLRATAGGATTPRKRHATDHPEPGTAGAPLPLVGDTELSHSSGDALISYPFPLQSGGIATLRLPVRLDRADAERLATFVRTLVFEPQKELTKGLKPNG
jgi:hypothetical protein